MKIISWQSLLTNHQTSVWQAMQENGHEVTFILGKIYDEDREKQGWTKTDLDQIKYHFLSAKSWWKTANQILKLNRDGIHIFGGFWADRRFLPIILASLRMGIKTVIMNESYSEVQTGYLNEGNRFTGWLKVRMRPLFYRLAFILCKLASGKNRFCMLAIGSRAERQFLQAGLKIDQIFPWGYFIPQSEIIKNHVKNRPPVRLVYIGNLLYIKGLDLAINAVTQLNKDKMGCIRLDVYGYGDPDRWITTSSMGITYNGLIPFGHSQVVIRNYDYLVLPSRHDGWGVVVNEALLQCVPVILSDRVGAKTLIDKSKAGLQFESGNTENLKEILVSLLANQQKHAKYAERAAQMAEKITPSAAAVYLEEILQYYFFTKGQRPIPNWER